MSYWDSTLTPAPPYGVAEGMGQTPYPFNDIADVAPPAGRGHADGMGDSPYSSGTWDTEPILYETRNDNADFDVHRSGLIGPAKPGSF